MMKNNEKGSATILAVIILTVVIIGITTASVAQRVKETKAREDVNTRQTELWEAKGAARVLDRVTQVRLTEQYSRDVAFAQNCASGGDLTPFDDARVNSDSSIPAAIVDPDENATRCGRLGLGIPTSLLGNLDNYLQNRRDYLYRKSEDLGYPESRARFFSIKESVRRFSDGEQPVYQIHYILDGRGGRLGRHRIEGDLYFGDLSVTCGTTATLTASPEVIEQGQSVTLTVSYSMATNLKIYETGGGTLIHEASLSESPNLQTYTYTFSPSATNSYRVEAVGSAAGCSSQSGEVTVEVTVPQVCAANPPAIAVFESSAYDVAAGETFYLRWQTSGGIESVYLDDTQVARNETAYPLRINETTTFRLRVTDSDPVNSCPAESELTVRVRVTPPTCSPIMPSVTFTADRTTISAGESVNFAWSVAGMQSGGTITFLDSTGQSQSINPTGNLARTFNTPGTYQFKIKAVNSCPDGNQQVDTKTITIVVTNALCPVPVINNFSVSPTTVVSGGSQNITFSWNATDSSGQGASAVLYAGNTVLAANLPLVGSFTVVQPQLNTTYRLQVTNGCGQIASAQTQVTMQNPPTSCNGTPLNGNSASFSGGEFYDNTGYVDVNGHPRAYIYDLFDTRLSSVFNSNSHQGSLKHEKYEDYCDASYGVGGQHGCDCTVIIERLDSVKIYDIYNNLIFQQSGSGGQNVISWNFSSITPIGRIEKSFSRDQYDKINDGYGGCYETGNYYQYTESFCSINP